MSGCDVFHPESPTQQSLMSLFNESLRSKILIDVVDFYIFQKMKAVKKQCTSSDLIYMHE